ncbi:DNA modification methylase [Enterovirga sp. CN4-39]|uniref:DNA modification methylase n=1 Tax=Enterovirga sp. CN4-39 TaxID=3400910 RepID=UPI003C097A24
MDARIVDSIELETAGPFLTPRCDTWRTRTMQKIPSRSLNLARGLRATLGSKDVERRAETEKLSRSDHLRRQRNDLLVGLTRVDRDPDTLTIPKRNVRGVKESHVKEVMNSIEFLGFSDPVLIDQNGEVIDGVIRVLAARALRLPLIPCELTAAHTATEKRILRLTLNRLGEKGDWVLEPLKAEVSELIVEDAPITITGFEEVDLDGLLEESPKAVEKGPLEPPDRPAISRRGDLFLLGRHRVLCGSAIEPLDIARVTAGSQARLVLTDIPYNKKIRGNVTRGAHREFVMGSGEMSDDKFLDFNQAFVATAIPHLMDGGILGTFIDGDGLPFVLMGALSAGLAQLSLVVWVKSNAGMGGLYRSQHEVLPLFKKGTERHVNNIKLGQNGRSRSNVWRYPGASAMGSDARAGLKQHPTVKPVAMLKAAMLDLTNPDEIILDPFLGSGSSVIAAEECRRTCYGTELDPRYVDVIIQRYNAATGQEARLEETGETFAELTQRRAREAAAAMAVDAIRTSRGRSRPARRQAA